MRIRAFISAVVFGIILTVSAQAATKCVALDAATSCSSSTENLRVDWDAICGNVAVKGIGVCAGVSAPFFQTADSLATVNTSEENKYCWCKMTSPAASKYVYVAWDSSATNCSVNCAARCGSLMRRDAKLRTVLFSNFE